MSKVTKKLTKKSTLATYRKKIINPKTKRYVFLDTKLGEQINKKFNELLKKKKRTAGEQKYVYTILYSKFCKCTKSIIIRESKKESPNKRLPYAVCTKKIYNNRKLKIPKNGARNCRKTFKWYT